MRRNQLRNYISVFLFPLLAAGVLFFFLSSLSHLSSDHSEEDRQQLETALARAAVACYASEGVYPPNVQYLVEHYGVQINSELYLVKYEVIASNLMPDITVLEVTDE